MRALALAIVLLGFTGCGARYCVEYGSDVRAAFCQASCKCSPPMRDQATPEGEKKAPEP